MLPGYISLNLPVRMVPFKFSSHRDKQGYPSLKSQMSPDHSKEKLPDPLNKIYQGRHAIKYHSDKNNRN